MVHATALNYMGCGYSNDDVRLLCEVLELSRTLKLNLNKNDISDEGLNPLCKTLIGIGVLRRLRLDYNKISNASETCLIELIQNLKPLTSLSLKVNPLCRSASVDRIRSAWVDVGKDIRLLNI